MVPEFSRLIVRTFFREVVIEGRDHLPQKGPVIFTPNHPNGLLDPLLMFFLSPTYRLRFVAKAPLFKIPVFGSILKSIGAIPVVRRMEADGEVDYTTFFASCVDALGQGDSIVIFPEGRSLPQAYMAPLRTGPARLFFLAHERGIHPRIIPVGLNYEQGTTFRSSVLMVLSPPIETESLVTLYQTDQKRAVRQLTEEIAESLRHHVVEAETYRDRELMLLLERISATSEDHSWVRRFQRVKEFEKGIARLGRAYAKQIDRLRKQLERYRRLSTVYGLENSLQKQTKLSARQIIILLLGNVLSMIGWILNWLPYRLTDLLVRWTGKDESDAATFKVVFSLFVFPIIYVLEGILFSRAFGWWAGVLFAILIIPLSYFTLFFSEWRNEVTAGKMWFGGKFRAARQLERLRQRISGELEALASRSEMQ